MALRKSDARLALNLVRAGIGVGALVAPRLTGRLLAIDPGENRSLAYLARLFGVRELFMAAVSAAPGADDDLFRFGLAVDGVDFAAALVARARGQVRPRAVLIGAAGMAVAAVLGRAASRAEVAR